MSLQDDQKSSNTTEHIDSYEQTFELSVPFAINPEFLAEVQVDSGEDAIDGANAPEAVSVADSRADLNQSMTAEEFLGIDQNKQPDSIEALAAAGSISYANATVTEVLITEIIPNPYQPRKNFDLAQLRELADSIIEHGVIQPLVVNQTPRGFELVVGERRFRASQMAGLQKVPVIIKSGMADQQKLEIALIENIQRQELNAIEEAQAYDKLMKLFGLTQEKIAQKVGKSRPAVANTIRLLNLPAEIQRGIIEKKLSEGHARAILGLSGIERQLALYKLIVDQSLNVRQVEAKVRELMARPRLEAAGPDVKTLALEYQLRDRLGTKVKIEKKGTGGKIMIEFFSEDQLKALLDKFETINSGE